MNNFEGKKVDVLLRKVLKEEAENVNVPDKINDDLVKNIEKKKIINKNLNKEIGVCTFAGISLFIITITISVIILRKIETYMIRKVCNIVH